MIYFEKTTHVKKYILRGERNVRYYDRILFIKKKLGNITTNFT